MAAPSAEPHAVCAACGADKDVPLARCGACGVVPQGTDREVALLLSTRFLTREELARARDRIRRGERPEPGPARRAEARALLAGTPLAPRALSRAAVVGLVVGNLLLSPLLGWAIWLRWRGHPGPGARQVWWATAPLSLALLIAWIGWRARLLP